jgi:hypothetical protein
LTGTSDAAAADGLPTAASSRPAARCATAVAAAAPCGLLTSGSVGARVGLQDYLRPGQALPSGSVGWV